MLVAFGMRVGSPDGFEERCLEPETQSVLGKVDGEWTQEFKTFANHCGIMHEEVLTLAQSLFCIIARFCT
jgi:hypothetical protein